MNGLDDVATVPSFPNKLGAPKAARFAALLAIGFTPKENVLEVQVGRDVPSEEATVLEETAEPNSGNDAVVVAVVDEKVGRVPKENKGAAPLVAAIVLAVVMVGAELVVDIKEKENGLFRDGSENVGLVGVTVVVVVTVEKLRFGGANMAPLVDGGTADKVKLLEEMTDGEAEDVVKSEAEDFASRDCEKGELEACTPGATPN